MNMDSFLVILCEHLGPAIPEADICTFYLVENFFMQKIFM